MDFFLLFNELLCLKIIIPFTGSVQCGGVIGAEQANNILFMPLCPGIVLSFEMVWLQMPVDKTLLAPWNINQFLEFYKHLEMC